MAQRGVDYWTTEDQPFITKDMLFGGIGSMARGLFIPREADLQRFPRFVTDPRVGLPPPTNRNLSEKKKKLAVKAVERGAKAAASLVPYAEARQRAEVEERTIEMQRAMALEQQDARRNAMRMPIDPRLGMPQGAFPASAMPPTILDPGVVARTEEMRKIMALEQQDARYIAAANAALGPRGGTDVLGGNKTGIPANPIDPREHAAAQLANQDDARLAARGAPPAGQAGIAALMGANTGIPVPPPPASLTGQTVLSGDNTGIPYDPNALSNRLENYITEREGDGPTGLGADLIRAGDAAQKQLDYSVKKTGEKVKDYVTADGPYGSGQSELVQDLIGAGDAANAGLNWAWDKGGDFFNWLAETEYPGDIGKASPEQPAAPITDPAILFPDEELPAEGGGEGDKAESETDTLDAALQKYLDESDTSYEDALETINKAYGDLAPDYSNPKQDQADAYAAREGERTAALAQLALAGGLVKSAGKSWEGAGQGFIDAAGVYDKGFERYHNTLIKSAELHETRRRDDRAFEIAKRDAAISMWQTGRTDYRATMKELMTQAREERKADRDERKTARKDELSYVDSVFKSRIETKFPKEMAMEMDEAGQAALNEEYEMWALSRRMGRPLNKQEYDYIKAKAAAEAAAKATDINVDLTGD
jgi:hypothetical protein